MIHSTILDAIGNTPLVPIRRLNPYKNVTILAKLESFNPGGSIKDRIALSMIEGAEKRGELTKDKIVLEASSGNTGIGLAMVCAIKGYKCLIAMSESASLERRQIMRAYGAEILLTPAALGTDGAIETVYKMARDNPEIYFCTDQFNNPDNYLAHYNGTALEIWEQTKGQVTYILATMGTTGTLMGIKKRMQEMAPSVKVIGVEPYLGHRIQGLKNMKESYKPGIFDKHLPDAILNVHDDEAFEMTRRLAREEGLFVGMSSGAALVGALRIASQLDNGLVVVIFPDGGERYLSTGLFAVPEEEERIDKTHNLRLTNTLTRKKEVFESIEPGKVRIYSCGPTAYEYAHLGLCRRVVVADLLRRALEHLGYQIIHVMNITDIDDKTIDAALSKALDLKTFTQIYIQAFLEDVKVLGVRPAFEYPLASQHIEDMIELTQRLIDKGFAYVKHGSVYFDISKLPSYGRLSRVNLDHIQVGITVDLDDYEKDSPVDFTLFKRVTLRELKNGIGYDTPWGQARPGWHIECAAMSMKYLGDYFDIHTSGCDLIFPHHENEIAIAMALSERPLARIWLHSEMVLVDGKKMSRSAKNVITLKDLIERGYTGRQVRFYLMRTHYRKALNFSFENLDQAVRALRRLDNFVADIISYYTQTTHEVQNEQPPYPLESMIQELKDQFFLAVNDDLNLSMGLGVLFRFIRDMNHMIKEHGPVTKDQAKRVLEALMELDQVLGLMDLEGHLQEKLIPEKVTELLKRRDEARRNQDWAEADQIRQRLIDIGYEVIDTPQGTRVRPKVEKE